MNGVTKPDEAAESIAHSLVRIAEGLERRNVLLEESNAMARARYEADQAILEAYRGGAGKSPAPA